MHWTRRHRPHPHPNPDPYPGPTPTPNPNPNQAPRGARGRDTLRAARRTLHSGVEAVALACRASAAVTRRRTERAAHAICTVVASRAPNPDPDPNPYPNPDPNPNPDPDPNPYPYPNPYPNPDPNFNQVASRAPPLPCPRQAGGPPRLRTLRRAAPHTSRGPEA